MNYAAHVAAMELLGDVSCESCVPALKHAGWKRDQYMRRPRSLHLTFFGDVGDAQRAPQLLRLRPTPDSDLADFAVEHESPTVA